MKKLIIILLLWFSIIYSSYSQTILYGEQVRGANKNAELVCEPIVLTATMKIATVEGDNAGFWLEGQNGAIQSFYKDNNRFFPEAIGYQLVPGKYWVYPNLEEDKEKSTVKLILEIVN